MSLTNNIKTASNVIANNIKSSFVAISRPTTVSLDNDAINENNQVGDLIGNFTFDGTAPVTVQAVAEAPNDNTAFTFSNNQLTAAEVFDYEDDTQKTIKVKAVNAAGESDTITLTIDITNVPDVVPVANNVAIDDTTPTVGQQLTGSYVYNANEGGSEATSTFRWLKDDVAISGATSINYIPVAGDAGSGLAFEVTPVGTVLSGTAVQSAATSAVVSLVTIPSATSFQDGSDASTIIQDGSNKVSAWNDSENANNLTNTNSNTEWPTYNAAEGRTEFGGSSRLAWGSSIYNNIGASVDFAMFILVDITSMSDQVLFASNRTSTDRIGICIRSGSIIAGYYNGSFTTTSKVATIGDNQLITFRNTGGVVSLRVNSVEYKEVPPGNLYTTNTTDFAVLGNLEPLSKSLSLQFSGNIRKVKIHTSVVNAEDLLYIENDLLGLTNSGVYEMHGMAGQSNMDGRGDLVDLTSPLTDIIPRSYVWDEDKSSWSALLAGVNGSSTEEVGPIFKMAYDLSQANPTRQFLYVHKAVGGAPLGQESGRDDWSPSSSGQLYDDFVAAYNTAHATIIQGSVNKKGMGWFQGERDASKSFGASYEINESGFFTALQAALGFSHIFSCNIYSGLPQPIYSNVTAVRTAKSNNLASSVVDNLEDADSYGIQTDNIHLTTAGANDLGADWATFLNSVS